MVEPTETVSVLFTLPFAGGVTEAGLKLHDVPAGRFAQERVTALAKPLMELTVQVVPPLLPCWMVRLDGVHERLKSGVAPAVGVALTQLLARP